MFGFNVKEGKLTDQAGKVLYVKDVFVQSRVRKSEDLIRVDFIQEDTDYYEFKCCYKYHSIEKERWMRINKLDVPYLEFNIDEVRMKEANATSELTSSAESTTETVVEPNIESTESVSSVS